MQAGGCVTQSNAMHRSVASGEPVLEFRHQCALGQKFGAKSQADCFDILGRDILSAVGYEISHHSNPCGMMTGFDVADAHE